MYESLKICTVHLQSQVLLDQMTNKVCFLFLFFLIKEHVSHWLWFLHSWCCLFGSERWSVSGWKVKCVLISQFMMLKQLMILFSLIFSMFIMIIISNRFSRGRWWSPGIRHLNGSLSMLSRSFYYYYLSSLFYPRHSKFKIDVLTSLINYAFSLN